MNRIRLILATLVAGLAVLVAAPANAEDATTVCPDGQSLVRLYRTDMTYHCVATPVRTEIWTLELVLADVGTRLSDLQAETHLTIQSLHNRLDWKRQQLAALREQVRRLGATPVA